MASKYLWLLDPGHGGMIAGEYQTEGKQSPVWNDDSVLYEGEFNRAIVNRLCERMTAHRIDYVNVVAGDDDVSLRNRVNCANKIATVHPNRKCVYLSIHANAGGGEGFEVYTSPGETQSDQFASVFLDKMRFVFPTCKMRCDHSDGDPDKEAPFYVLKHTSMPAVLTENFFMDNEEECRRYLMAPSGREAIAHAHWLAIKAIEGIR